MSAQVCPLDAICLAHTSFSSDQRAVELPTLSEATKEIARQLCPTKELPDLAAALRNLREKKIESFQLKNKYDLENRNRFFRAVSGTLSLGIAVDYLCAEVLGISSWKLALVITVPLSLMAAGYLAGRNRSFSFSFVPVNRVIDDMAQFKEFFSVENFRPLEQTIQAKAVSNSTYETALKELQALSQLCHPHTA